MNIFSQLGSLFGRDVRSEADEPLTKDEIAAEEKAERIAFHRAKVRNGPTGFKVATAGQERRFKARAVKRAERKNFRTAVRNHLELQGAAAAARGHLQVVGILPYIDGREASLQAQIISTNWLVGRFGVPVESTGRISWKRGDVLDALQHAVDFYNKATGDHVTIPAGFEPAIVLDEAVA